MHSIPIMTEREAQIAFAAFSGIGPVRFKLLTDYFDSAKAAWNAPENILKNIGLGGKLTQKLLDFRGTFDVTAFTKQLLAQEIHIVTRSDSVFPQPLREISDPPIALFVRGTLPADWSRAIGVVGTRKVTAYGRQVTEKIVRDLVSSGCLIVSGMAKGVDGIAHRMAIEAGKPTVAVLGCGVDICYPPEHKDLYFQIIETGGAIISEVSPGHTVLKGLFPARNRIISGVTLGVVVTEGAEDSGSLITARNAAEQGRDVFAVPGPITSYLSAGPARLIKQGAKMVTTVEDILEELNIAVTPPYPLFGKEGVSLPFIKGEDRRGSITLNGEEKIIVELLTQGEKHYDEIVRESGLHPEKIGSLLTFMELNGILQVLDNGKYGLR